MKGKASENKKVSEHAAKTQKMHHEMLKHHENLMKSHHKMEKHLTKHVKKGE